MAFRYSELRLILTARNEASRTLRRVARDVGRLDDNERARQQMMELSRNAKVLRMRRDLYEMDLAAAYAANSLAKQQDRNQAASLRKIAQARIGIQTMNNALDANQYRIDRLNMALQQVPFERLEAGARTATHFGMALATVGAIGTGSLAVAANGAAQFSKQVTLAATQARPLNASFAETAKIAKGLSNVIIDQMQRFPATSQEMADSLYEIFSGTNIQNIDEGSKVLELFNKMAVAGSADLGTMTDAGITLLNNFVTPGGDRIAKLTKIADHFFSTVRYGRFSAEQFANSLSTVIPIAEAAGLQFEDITNAMAALTRQSGGRVTQRDATGLARLIELLARKDVQDGLRQVGEGIAVERPGGGLRPLRDIIRDINDVAKLKPGADTLNFFDRMSQLGTGGRGNQGTIQARRVFNFLIQNMEEYDNVANKVNRTQGEFQKSFEAMSRTPGIEWDVTINQLRALVILIGREAIPVFTQLAFPLVQILHWFNELDPATRKWISTAIAFTAVGSLILGSVVALGGGLTILLITLVKLSRSFSVMERLGATAATVARSTKGLSGQTGFLQLRLLGVLGIVVSAVPLFARFHSEILEITTGARGLEGVLKAVGIVLTAMTVSFALRRVTALAGAFMAAARTAKAAGSSIGILLTLLRRLPSVVAISIVISVFMNQDRIQDVWDDVMGKIGLGQEKINSVKDMIKNRTEIIGTFGQEKFREMYERMLSARGLNPKKIMRQSATEAMQAIGDIPFLDFLENRANAQQAKAANLLNKLYSMDPRTVRRDRQKWADAGFSDTEFMDQLRKVDRLRQAFEDAPNIATWRAYHKALDALTAKSDEEQKKMINDLLGNLDKITEKMLAPAVFASRFAELERLRKAAENSTDPKVIEEYYKAQEQLSRNASNSQMRAAEEAASNAERLHGEEMDRRKEAAAEAKRQLEEAKGNLRTAVSTVMGAYQEMQQTNQQAFGTLFSGPFINSAVAQNRLQHGFGLRKSDLMRDITMQVQGFKQWRNMLTQLQTRGAPQEFIDQVRQMGPEAQDELRKLLTMNTNEFNNYMNQFRQGQKLVEQATRQDLNRELKRWQTFGQNVARAIVLGIRSQDAALENSMRNLVLRMFPGLGTAAGARPQTLPSTSGPIMNNTIYAADGVDLEKKLKDVMFYFRNQFS